MTTSFGTTATPTTTASASPAVFPAKNAPKSLTLLPFCHHRRYNPSRSKLSLRFATAPKLQFSCKGLQTSRNHSAVVRAQLNEVAVGGSSNDAATPITQSEEVKSPSETSSATSVSEESISNFISQVSSLVKLVDSRDVVELHLKQLDCEILIRKKEALPQPPPPAPAHTPLLQSYHVPSVQSSPPPAPAPAAPPVQIPAPSPAAAKPSDSSVPPLKCPMAGTFYRSPGPGEPPFVKVGDKVQKGQVLCIIEAMKLMNEIEADQSGTIIDILAEDGKPVSVDMPLFVIKP
ncbi:PREDICTED: biotin carboxyl carrier protein of acetyl-CoA carboxylase, chloroplastic-like isoform X2 [Nicotiana attenuata]|uniref:Biotin carboxyl carrier protein of acetyl-CoA carboxylase n=1 Tax=Nicotiana attenuata TaxID=49451 RepID=A0A314L7X8_NICAT|nr:PREDICTED: biotin carboxyl carrier protein of acetyl-CoA carboxylase, chloroplastic-like isoform X2 [Nicotiana attenuata]OIT37179.1 biotin carboxyl carrier protein of acetyl-coa carboxylase 1, chloroplastic [Nicotiana attenuata]